MDKGGDGVELSELIILFPETVSIVRNFTFQKTITKAFGRQTTTMISCKELKSLVINEIFDNVRIGAEMANCFDDLIFPFILPQQRVIFMLQVIVQSNTDQDDKKPKIIPLFEVGTDRIWFIPELN